MDQALPAIFISGGWINLWFNTGAQANMCPNYHRGRELPQRECTSDAYQAMKSKSKISQVEGISHKCGASSSIRQGMRPNYTAIMTQMKFILIHGSRKFTLEQNANKIAGKKHRGWFGPWLKQEEPKTITCGTFRQETPPSLVIPRKLWWISEQAKNMAF